MPWLSGYPAQVVQNSYVLVKNAMPWIVVGFLLSLVWSRTPIQFGVIVILPVLILLDWSLNGLNWSGIRDVLFTLPGLWAGLWLAEQTRLAGAGGAAMVGGTKLLEEEKEADGAVPDQGAAQETPSGSATISSLPSLALRGAGLLLLAGAFVALANFPHGAIVAGLGIALALYVGVLWYWPRAWMVVVPAALPLLDLAPWTGRFYFDEFDLLMLATAGMLLLRGRPRNAASMRVHARPLMVLVVLSALASLIVGVLPLSSLDANAMASYWSPFNGLRVAKGMLWGGLIFLWLNRVKLDRQVLAHRLALGMGLGLLGVGLVGAWEHHLFVGFEDRLETYRIVSTFSSMHTGGGHIEAYLVAALPFLWLATSRFRHLLFTAPVMLLTAYVMLYTVARGGVLALGIVIAILALASARLGMRSHGRRYVAPVAMLVVVGMVLAGGVGVGHFQQRFAKTAEDWQTRVDHWGEVLDMMDGTVGAQLFGMGLGSFPRMYQERGPVDKQPASFGFADEQGNTYFRLGTGETVYYAQRIPFSAGKAYRLEVDLRSRQGDTRMDTPVCEKQLLNSRQCEWFSFDVAGDGQWHRLSHTFSSTKVGAEGWWNRPPVELFLYHPGKGGVVDVDNLRLVDQDGQDVLCNGNFSHGGDCWFFKTHSHLPWHIKNVWVHVLFEQGWVGLLLFQTLTGLALYRLARAGWRGHRLAWTWLASLAGLLTVGMFDSMLDAPRLATLLVAWSLVGAGFDWESRHTRHRRSTLRSGAQ